MLSIIIPCLNESDSIQTLLESLQGARAAGVELVLADGGSGDNTVALSTPWVSKVVVTAAGRARQMNAGAAVASGEILWFLHADSVIGEDFPRLIESVMARSARPWGRFTVCLSGRHPLLRIVEFMMNWRSRITGIVTGDQGLFIHRELFVRMGGFPEIPLMEDIAISKRLRRVSPPLVLPQRLVTSSRRWETHGIAFTILLMWRLRWAYFRGANPADLAQRYR
ncbi:TIGR04283 family arsenosugar biosynthesis glycosyltransferase [Sedimenticola sp.]|uniref:TIGR04283 family arsenosugar biosynthesis glycosyltransferase n=1 Tax=Sedimenticola sp. TaxID=1940285 RepID=UPI003D129999